MSEELYYLYVDEYVGFLIEYCATILLISCSTLKHCPVS